MINEIFETLASNNSRLFKLDVLKQHKDNDLLKRVIFLALDPFTQFYIRKIPSYTISGYNRPLEDSIEMLKELSNRIYTGNVGIQFLKDILTGSSLEDAKVIERIIAKDLKCGVSTATVNTVWSDFIHEYPCMLASGYEQKLVNKIPFPALVQLKLDGMRFNAIVLNNTVEFRSRNGKQIHIPDSTFSEYFISMANGRNIVFDGELLVKDGDNLFDRQTGNGILNKAVKGTQSEEEGKMVCATLWDMISYDSFIEGICEIPYHSRLYDLKNIVFGDRIDIAPTHEVNSIEEAHSLFEYYFSLGQEGIILKDKNAVWENKRSKKQIKFKGELECDLVIVDIEDGNGKYEGMVGAFICESLDKVIQVKVGSGLTDEQRKSFTNFDIGKIVTIKYNARIKNKQGEESLFLPIFLEIREDKTEPDHSKNIK